VIALVALLALVYQYMACKSAVALVTVIINTQQQVPVYTGPLVPGTVQFKSLSILLCDAFSVAFPSLKNA
jgi:hypothetical protein